MKVMLRTNGAGHLTVYVAKKDLEEEVVAQTREANTCILTLANGWQLSVPDLDDPIPTPQTVRAQRL